MRLLSCTNCCFNGLQYDAIGTPFGYCVEHRVVLHFADELTCGRHFRKDLTAARAEQEHAQHAQRYLPTKVVSLKGTADASSAGMADKDTLPLRKDPVGEVVTDYGNLGAKIESLSQLRQMPGARAEIALLSLGRSYVRRCVSRNNQWTSGIHILYWIRQKMLKIPEVNAIDLRMETALPATRQIELAIWSVMMLRLIFISDIGHYARKENPKVGALERLAEEAASETSQLDPSHLLTWAKRSGIRRFDKALPESAYIRLARMLHKD
jgi:hypothetical protein